MTSDENGPLKGVRTDPTYGATYGSGHSGGSGSAHPSPADELEITSARALNKWGRLKHKLREPFAEFLGTLALVALGTGSVAQSQFFTAGDFVSLSLAFGLALMVGIYISGGVSGGHLNPAVTITKLVFRRFPAHKVPGYILAQFLGAFVGAAIVYGSYESTISSVDGGVRAVTGPNATAGIFATYPTPGLSIPTAFLTEAVGTFFLVLTILAVTDHRHNPNNTIAPLAIGLSLTCIALSFGHLTGFALNSARDFGPRLFTFLAGYGTDVWTADNYYFVVPLVAPIVGGLVSGFVYDALIYTGVSPLN